MARPNARLTSTPPERLLKPDEVADLLGVPKTTIYGWRYRGEGPPGLRVGRHLRYRRRDLDHWIESRIDGGGNG